jgi:hypothetical protein
MRSVRSAAYPTTKSRFGITAAFTGPVRERGRQMKLGIETAFNQVNDAGGVGGRKLRIIAADDGNEPAAHAPGRAAALREGPDLRPHGSIGTATAAAVAVPYALERRMLFFGAYTGGNVVRRDPPGPLCLQLPSELCRGSRRPRCAIW